MLLPELPERSIQSPLLPPELRQAQNSRPREFVLPLIDILFLTSYIESGLTNFEGPSICNDNLSNNKAKICFLLSTQIKIVTHCPYSIWYELASPVS